MAGKQQGAQNFCRAARGAMNKRPRVEEAPAAPAKATGANAVPVGSIEAKVTADGEEEYFDKANFALSGALAKDERTGNTLKSSKTGTSVVSKYSQPEDATAPFGSWRIFVFKGEECLETLYLHRKNYYVFGRDDELADIVVAHPSCSKEHAVLQYRKRQGGPVALYLIDLESTNGTYLNDEKTVPARYIEVRDGDVINLGQSSRDYVMKFSSNDKSAT